MFYCCSFQQRILAFLWRMLYQCLEWAWSVNTAPKIPHPSRRFCSDMRSSTAFSTTRFLTCLSEPTQHWAAKGCAAPHNLCPSTGQANSMLAASVIPFLTCIPLVFHTVFKWLIFFRPTDIYLDSTYLIIWMAFCCATALTTSVLLLLQNLCS